MMIARHYVPEADRGLWDDFVCSARNATFLHRRDYMDYHADRFTDASLIVADAGRTVALFPANLRADGSICSHGGLTYGGLITAASATQQTVIDAFAAINDLLRAEGRSRVDYKPLPHIYHRLPAEEDLYALFATCGAVLSSRAVSSAIDTSNRLRLTENRRRGAKKAAAAGVTVGRSDDFAPFWSILTDNLADRHGVAPVHTLNEITLLHSRFPDNIRLHTATLHGRTVAGCVLYVTHSVTHVQYISASPEGRACGALDLLFATLIDGCTTRWFDFGISTEQGGHMLNSGLIHQKEGFGARAICYDSYSYSLTTK